MRKVDALASVLDDLITIVITFQREDWNFTIPIPTLTRDDYTTAVCSLGRRTLEERVSLF